MRGGNFIVLAWGGFLGGLTFLLATDFALTKAAWCASEEAHCLRDWIGALSGWVGAMAAFFTILFLVRQIAESSRQQRENVAIQIMSRAALCRKLERATRMPLVASRNLANIEQDMTRKDSLYSEFEGYVASNIRFIEALPIALIEKFEDEIGVESGPAATGMRLLVTNIRKQWDRYTNDQAADPTRVLADLAELGKASEENLYAIRERAEVFLRRWAPRSETTE